MRDKNKSRDVLFRWGPKSDPIFDVLGGGEWFGVFILQNVAIRGLGHSRELRYRRSTSLDVRHAARWQSTLSQMIRLMLTPGVELKQ